MEQALRLKGRLRVQFVLGHTPFRRALFLGGFGGSLRLLAGVLLANRLLSTDTQHQVAASRQVLRAGQRRRYALG